MPAATMTPLDWSAIVARAQEAHRLRRWAQFQTDIGDAVSAARLIARAERAEAIVLAIARRSGAAVDEPVSHLVDVQGSAAQWCYWPQVKAHPRAVEFAR